ncbi:MAG: hypothetical protein IJ087_20995 [Eggerthellaceae bacterium]|nr:hypothetical protein [Eggerthellaceae bacterium]
MKGKVSTGNLAACAIGLLLFLVYGLAVYLFAGELNSTAFISIGFTVVAFICVFAVPRLVGSRPDIEAVFFGIPLFGFAMYYFFAQIFLSAVFIFFQNVIPGNIAFFIQLVVLVAFIIVTIVSFTAQRSAAQKSDERKEQAANRNIEVIDVKGLVDMCRSKGMSPSTLHALEHLSDTVRYSDPFSGNHPVIVAIEDRISSKMLDLQSACSSGDDAAITGIAQELENLYAERSRKLLLIK